jgi:hypothetical protein
MQIDVVNGITRLTADDGKVLVKDGSVGTEVWLSALDGPNNWREIDASLIPDPEMGEQEIIDELEVLLNE